MQPPQTTVAAVKRRTGAALREADTLDSERIVLLSALRGAAVSDRRPRPAFLADIIPPLLYASHGLCGIAPSFTVAYVCAGSVLRLRGSVKSITLNKYLNRAVVRAIPGVAHASASEEPLVDPAAHLLGRDLTAESLADYARGFAGSAGPGPPSPAGSAALICIAVPHRAQITTRPRRHGRANPQP